MYSCYTGCGRYIVDKIHTIIKTYTHNESAVNQYRSTFVERTNIGSSKKLSSLVVRVPSEYLVRPSIEIDAIYTSALLNQINERKM